MRTEKRRQGARVGVLRAKESNLVASQYKRDYCDHASIFWVRTVADDSTAPLRHYRPEKLESYPPQPLLSLCTNALTILDVMHAVIRTVRDHLFL